MLFQLSIVGVVSRTVDLYIYAANLPFVSMNHVQCVSLKFHFLISAKYMCYMFFII